MNQIRHALSSELSFFWSLPAVLWQIVFVGMPVLIIFYSSITVEGSGFWWERLTLVHYAGLMSSIYFAIIFRSLVLALGTAVTCLLCAYPVAYFLALYARRGKNFLLFLLTLPFWVNFLVQVFSWFFLLETDGLINTALIKLGIISSPIAFSSSLFSVYLVMVYCYLPFMIMPLYSKLSKIDRRLLEASADLGATSWQTFRRVMLPLSLSGIKTGMLLVLIPAFGEFVIPSLFGGSKQMLVGSLISYYFFAAQNNPLGAAFTCLSSMCLLGIIIVVYGVSSGIEWRSRGEE